MKETFHALLTRFMVGLKCHQNHRQPPSNVSNNTKTTSAFSLPV